MSDALSVVQYGCGPIGCRIASYLLEKDHLELVGAVDIDPRKVDRDLGAFLPGEPTTGVTVEQEATAVLEQRSPDVVLHATGSSFATVLPQLEECLQSGAQVISTCEELSYPYWRYPEEAAELDEFATTQGGSLLGTGVNPGFVMDAWPLFMSSASQDVKRVHIVRQQDASPRRLPFQKKIGAGCTVEEVREKIAANEWGHVGLTESIAMVAEGLGWELDDITEEIEPVVAEEEVASEEIRVAPGEVVGLRQNGEGLVNDRPVITLDFQAYLGADQSLDRVRLEGTPDLTVTIEGGLNGDLATAALVVNTIPTVLEAPSGLLTMNQLTPSFHE